MTTCSLCGKTGHTKRSSKCPAKTKKGRGKKRGRDDITGGSDLGAGGAAKAAKAVALIITRKFLDTTASDFFAEWCPDELVMVFALLSREHLRVFRAAKRDVNSMKITDVVQSVGLLEDAARVHPQLSLPSMQFRNGVGDWRFCEAAVEAGHLNVLIRAVELGCPLRHMHHNFYTAIGNGSIDVMAWLYDRDRKYPKPNKWDRIKLALNLRSHKAQCRGGPCVYAAHQGQLEALQWLRKAGAYKKRKGCICPWIPAMTLHAAAKSANLSVIQWIRMEDPVQAWSTYQVTCADVGSNAAPEWDKEPEGTMDEVEKKRIAERQLEAVKWMRATGCPWGNQCEKAAALGHVGILKFAHENGCPWDSSTTEAAARHGHVNTLEYALQNKCPYDVDAMFEAAIEDTHVVEGPQRHVLEWLTTVAGIPWSPMAPKFAATAGDLELLKWMAEVPTLQQGGAWNAAVCSATLHGSFPRDMGPHQRMFHMFSNDTYFYGGSRWFQHWDVLKWLRTEKNPPCPWDEETKAAAIQHFGGKEVASWG